MDTKVGQLFYEIVAKFDNSFSTNIKKAETNVKQLGSEMDKSEKKASGFGETLTKLAKGLGLLYLGKLILDFGKQSVQAFANAQQSMIQFNNAQMNVNGTTKEQIEDLNKYILALEKKTSIDDKSIRQASQIYAQDQLSIENQKKLLQGTIDLAVANSKANGGEVDVSGTAKALGLALSTGDLGRLTKQNIAGITETQKKMFELGDDTQRTAILMGILDQNAKGAGEALGKSFQGQINRAKDTLEDLQVAVGQGLSVALDVLAGQIGDTIGGFEIGEQKTNKLGVAFVYLAGLIGFVINTLKLMGIGLVQVGLGLFNLNRITLGFGKDVIGVFGKVRTAITSIGEAMVQVLKGNFKEAKDALKDGFDFSGVFDNTKKALDASTESQNKLSAEFERTTKSIGSNLTTMVNAKEVYTQTATAQAKLTEAKSNLNKATERQREATEEEKKATEDAKKKLEDFTKQLVDTTTQSQKTSKELNENLTKSFKDFSKTISETFAETQQKLSEIVVDAENKKKELLAKSDRTADDEAQLKKLQATLDARVGFEERSAKQIEAIRQRLKDAGLDPNSLQVNTGQKTLEDQIAEARKNATLDEFTLFENTQNAKLLKLTNDFITETLLLKNKIDTQKKFEDELTTFLISENSKRTADIEAFAQNAIAKYGEMASSLRNVISLQAQAGAIRASATPTLPQFHDGGFVGSQGGQVHAGEFVVPSDIVSANPDLINMLDKARNQTNNITINTTPAGDLRSASDELLWRLGRM